MFAGGVRFNGSPPGVRQSSLKRHCVASAIVVLVCTVKRHGVARVIAGRRRVIVAELWRGPSLRVNWRPHPSDAPGRAGRGTRASLLASLRVLPLNRDKVWCKPEIGKELPVGTAIWNEQQPDIPEHV
eukprot:gene606-biopygen5457